MRKEITLNQKLADFYLKTDYVGAAQEYSYNIRQLLANIHVLKANNKISEVALSLIENVIK